MDDNLETWLLETGDEVVQRMAESGLAALNDLERAIYCLWVIDYAVRNSGTLEPVDDLYPDAFRDLEAFARSKGLHHLRTWLSSASDEGAFCDAYYGHFEDACSQLRVLATPA